VSRRVGVCVGLFAFASFTPPHPCLGHGLGWLAIGATLSPLSRFVFPFFSLSSVLLTVLPPPSGSSSLSFASHPSLPSFAPRPACASVTGDEGGRRAPPSFFGRVIFLGFFDTGLLFLPLGSYACPLFSLCLPLCIIL